MIDWKKSAELNDCTVEWLKDRFKKFPNSNKKVWRVCEGKECDDERAIEFYQYSPLCQKCSLGTPEVIEANRLRAIEQWSNPEIRSKVSKSLIQYNLEHPEMKEKHSIFMKEYCNDSKWKKLQSEKMIRYYYDQDNRDAQSERLKNNPKLSGDSIIDHHYIYDHDNPEKYTMKVNRSKHFKIHWWMKKAKIIVPHLNATEDNKGIFGVI